MTDQELFAYTQERGKVLNEATRDNKYQTRDAEEPADVLLRDAIHHFAKDMYNKALLARDKYGFHPMGWACPDWREEMQRQMAEHVLKGDPRDTGWLSTIAWYHGWSTATPLLPLVKETPAAESALVNDAERKYLQEVLDCLPDSMSDFMADFLRRLAPAALLSQYQQGRPAPHTDDEKSDAYSATCTANGWTTEALQYTSEGALAWACFKAGYDFATTPTPVATEEGGGAELMGFEVEMIEDAIDELRDGGHPSLALAVQAMKQQFDALLWGSPRPAEVEAIKELASSMATVRASRQEVGTVRTFITRLTAPTEKGARNV